MKERPSLIKRNISVTGYPPSVPVMELRLVPAVCGSLVVPLIYQIAVELKFSRWAALLAGAFILLGKWELWTGAGLSESAATLTFMKAFLRS